MRNAVRKIFLPGLLVLALCLIGAELALRLVAVMPSEGAGMRSDRQIGFRAMPGIQGSNGLTTNAAGFNDREPPLSQVRIAFVGDSFTFGILPFAQVFPEQVALLLNSGAGYPVANLGIAGAGPKEYRRVIEHEVPSLQPEWVVVTIFIGNDILQAHNDYETIVFLGQLKMLPRPSLISWHLEDYFLFRLSRATWRQISNMSGLTPCANPAVAERFYPRLSPLLAETYGHELMFYRPSYERLVKQSSDHLINHVIEMGRKIREMGSKPLFVVAPSELQLNPALRRAIVQCHGVAMEDFVFGKPQQWLTESLARHGIPFLDLLPHFSKLDPETLYQSGDLHWNALGNQLAAAQIAQYIKARK